MEPSTNLCPLLPGQMVNVLDVPIQGNALFAGGRNVSSSSLDSTVFTLDPQDKYLPSGVRRATTTTAVHARKSRLPTITRPIVRALRNGSLGSEIAPRTPQRVRTALSLERPHSLLAIFDRMRQTRSAGSNAKSNLTWPRKIFSRAGQGMKQEAPDPVPGLARLHEDEPSLSPARIGDELELPIQLPSTPDNTDRAPTAFIVNLPGPSPKLDARPLEQLSSSACSQLAFSSKEEPGLPDGHVISSARNSDVTCTSSYYTPLEQVQDNLSYFAPVTTVERNGLTLSDHLNRLDLATEAPTDPDKMPLDDRNGVSNAVPSTESPECLELSFPSPKYGYSESLASHAASANFSPCFASNTTHSGHMSPYHLSQPETSEAETPGMSEFGDDLPPSFLDSDAHFLTRFDRPYSRAGSPDPSRQVGDAQPSHTTGLGSGPLCYSLPDQDHASVLTVRKLPSLTIIKPAEGSPFTTTQQSSKQDLVRSWNDGSEHQTSALGELVDDLGYLGRLIS